MNSLLAFYYFFILQWLPNFSVCQDHLEDFHKILYVYLFTYVFYLRSRKKKRALPSPASLTKCPQWPELGQTKAGDRNSSRSTVWLTGTHLLEPLPALSQSTHKQGSEIQSKDRTCGMWVSRPVS